MFGFFVLRHLGKRHPQIAEDFHILGGQLGRLAHGLHAFGVTPKLDQHSAQGFPAQHMARVMFC
ncbi:hypothetical protein, partial [Rivihabitans pingtungensis]|uniref:hypothetical protein n=1 Tax=Rivihabitans pingtungensis TaxID=1054498 RepID=UPI002C84DB14